MQELLVGAQQTGGQQGGAKQQGGGQPGAAHDLQPQRQLVQRQQHQAALLQRAHQSQPHQAQLQLQAGREGQEDLGPADQDHAGAQGAQLAQGPGDARSHQVQPQPHHQAARVFLRAASAQPLARRPRGLPQPAHPAARARHQASHLQHKTAHLLQQAATVPQAPDLAAKSPFHPGPHSKVEKHLQQNRRNQIQATKLKKNLTMLLKFLYLYY